MPVRGCFGKSRGPRVTAFLQPYLVKAKGWTETDFRVGVTDTILASVTFTALGSIIMMAEAAVLHPRGIVVSTPEDLIIGFSPATGPVPVDGDTVSQAAAPVAAAVGERKLKAIAIGQASTLLAIPLGVVAMLFALLDPRATKGRALPTDAKVFVVVGALLLLFNAGLTYVRIPDIIQRLMN